MSERFASTSSPPFRKGPRTSSALGSLSKMLTGAALPSPTTSPSMKTPGSLSKLSELAARTRENNCSFCTFLSLVNSFPEFLDGFSLQPLATGPEVQTCQSLQVLLKREISLLASLPLSTTTGKVDHGLG